MCAPRLAGLGEHLFGRAAPAMGSLGSPARTVPVLLALPSGGGAPADAARPWTEAVAGALARTSEGTEAPRRCRLRPLPPPYERAPGDLPLAVVLAAPSLDGIRHAYTVLKAFRRSAPPTVGVLLAGEADPDTARRCQARLAAGASQFLGLSLLDLGHLPDPGDGPCAAEAAGRLHRYLATLP